jgi:uncharacterized membrane protein YccC
LLGEVLRPPSMILAIAAIFMTNQPDIATSRRNALLQFAGATGGALTALVVVAAFGDKPWLLLPAQFAVYFFCFLFSRATSASLAFILFGILFAVAVPQYVSGNPVPTIFWSWVIASLGVGLGLLVQLVPRPDSPEDLLLNDLAGRLRTTAASLQRMIAGAGGRVGLETLATLEEQVRQLCARSTQDAFEARRLDAQAELVIGVQRIVAGVRWLDAEIAHAGVSGKLPDTLRTRMEAIRAQCAAAALALAQRRPPDTALALGAPEAMFAESSAAAAPEGAPEIAKTLSQLEAACARSLRALSFLGVPQRARRFAPTPAPPFFVVPPLSDPDLIRFAIKGALAAILGTLLYQATGWPEHTTNQFLIVVAAAQARAVGASVRDMIMRFSGTALGLACALLVIFFGLPSIQTVGGLLTVSAPVFFAAAWIQRSTRYMLAGIYCAVTYSVIALALPTDRPDLVAAFSRVRGLSLAILIVFIVGSVVWPSYARAGRPAAFARVLAPLAAGFRALPADRAGSQAVRDALAATQERLLDFLALLEIAELEPAFRSRAAHASDRAWLAASTPVQSLFLGLWARKTRRYDDPAAEPPAETERGVCEAFAASLDAIAARLGGRAVPAAAAPSSAVPSLAGYPEARTTYTEMSESLDRLEEALLSARRAVETMRGRRARPAPA